MSLYCLGNARTDEQRRRMRELEAAGTCLFCPDGLGRFGAGDAPRWQSPSWLVLDNDFPYRGAARHLLLVPRRHLSDLTELDPAEREEFWAALAAAKQLAGGAGYGLGARNGDCASTGATIAHLHLHLLVAEPGAEPLRMRFSGRSGLV